MFQVLNLATAQRGVGIIAGEMKLFPSFVSRRQPPESRGMYPVGKEAHFGLRLTVSGPENPCKVARFPNVKISALISPCLVKYGRIWLEKRGLPRSFKSRFVFPGVLPI